MTLHCRINAAFRGQEERWICAARRHTRPFSLQTPCRPPRIVRIYLTCKRIAKTRSKWAGHWPLPIGGLHPSSTWGRALTWELLPIAATQVRRCTADVPLTSSSRPAARVRWAGETRCPTLPQNTGPSVHGANSSSPCRRVRLWVHAVGDRPREKLPFLFQQSQVGRRIYRGGRIGTVRPNRWYFLHPKIAH